MVKYKKLTSQVWRTFLENHIKELVAIDFFVVPTVTFRMLYVFIVLSHSRRKIIHFNVTQSPTAAWTGQQIIEAFPYDTAPKYLIRDNDKIYGFEFNKRIDSLGIKPVKTAFKSPWQNAYCERVIGTIRRDCTDHVIIFNEKHLKRVLRQYINEYYNVSRTHLSLGKDCPEPRDIETPEMGKIVEIPILGGLHQRYCRQAA